MPPNLVVSNSSGYDGPFSTCSMPDEIGGRISLLVRGRPRGRFWLPALAAGPFEPENTQEEEHMFAVNCDCLIFVVVTR